MWYNTKVSELLNIDYPILQGPFGGQFSSVELVATVSNMGGLGGYGAYTLSPQEIIEVDNKIKAATDKPYNINLWVSDTDAPSGMITDEQYQMAVKIFKPYFDEVGIGIPEKPGPFKSGFENQVQVILDIRPKLFSFVFGIPSSDILEQCRKVDILTAGAAIINIGSVAGFVGAPGWSVYSATKAAVAAFSEVIALDVKEFGIKVTVVEPAGFRTGFLSKNSLAITESKIDGYQAVKNIQEHYLANNGQQPGDPEKAAEILIGLAEKEHPPIHLYLGRDAYNRASAKLAAMTAELEEWKSTTISADF